MYLFNEIRNSLLKVSIKIIITVYIRCLFIFPRSSGGIVMEPVGDTEKDLFRKSFWLMIGTLYMNVISFLFWIIASRFSTTEDVGYATTAFSLLMMLSGALTLGTDISILKYGSSKLKDEIFSASLMITGITTVVTSLMLLIWQGRGLYGDEYRIYILILAGVYPLFILGNFLSMALIGAGESEKVTIIRIITSTLKIVVVVLSAFVIGVINGVIILLSVSIPAAFGTILAVVYVRGVYTFKMESKAYISEALRVGISNLPQKIFGVIISNLGTILLAFFTSDPALVGMTYISLMIMLAISGFAGVFSTIALPQSVAKNSEVYVHSLRYGLLVTGALAAPVGAASWWILSIIKPEMSYVWKTLTILMPVALLITSVANVITELNYKSKNKEIALLGISMILSLFTLLYVFTRLEVTRDISIALSLALTYIIALVYTVFVLKISWFLRNLFVALLGTILGIITGLIVSYHAHPILGGLLAFSLFILLYSIVFKIVSIREVIALVKSILAV